MPAREIAENVYAVGAVDWDRTLFDALIPLPHGTSYNSYLIRGSEKTVLIDTVEPAKADILKKNLSSLKTETIDYIISNHAEQDHSGTIPEILSLYPEAKIVTNRKCRDMLLQLLDLADENFIVIEDRQTLSLGNKTLEFIFAPWVHWPETMFTYLKEDKLLFSCDLFGAHLATSRLYAGRNTKALEEAKRYYAEIMMPFARNITKHLAVLEEYEIDKICPSHGPVYDDPEFILSAYRTWNSGEVNNEVVLLYVSMHGSTEKMALFFAEKLIECGVQVKPFNMISSDIGEIAKALVNSATLVVATPAVLMGPHPNIMSAAYLTNMLKPPLKYVGVIGSFGWGNKLIDQLQNTLKNLNAEFLPPVLKKGHPVKEDLEALEDLASLIAQKHQALAE